jgi:hypothetical protein
MPDDGPEEFTTISAVEYQRTVPLILKKTVSILMRCTQYSSFGKVRVLINPPLTPWVARDSRSHHFAVIFMDEHLHQSTIDNLTLPDTAHKLLSPAQEREE